MIVLTDKKLNTEKLDGISIVKVSTPRELEKYNNNSEIIAICGSRAMAIAAAELNFPLLKLFQLTSAGFGAVLDMFEKIPNPITNKFRRLKNVVVFPGVSAISQELNERLRVHMSENVCAAIEGREIKSVINGVK